MSVLSLADIQGFILRGYTMPYLRCLVLRIDHQDGARRFLRNVGGDITTATPWSKKPSFCLNIGITSDGLRVLGVPEDTLQSFPAEFQEGALRRAAQIGDVGASAPENWTGKFASGETHLVLWLFAQTRDELEFRSEHLRRLFPADDGLSELSRHDSQALPDGLVHFGYRDSISQPNIEGGPWAGLDDPLPRAPAGEFLLGYPSQFRDFTYPVPKPNVLGLNGSFAAFRILQQDVHGFETFLQETAPKIGMSTEKLAAKICGRWRNGVPLALSPDTDAPPPQSPMRS